MLEEGLRTHLPCLSDIAVFCMSIYMGVFPQATEGKEWLGRVVKRLDVSVFINCLFNLWFLTSVHRIISQCVPLIELGQILGEMHGLTRHPA